VVDGRQRMPMLASVARVPDIRVARLLAFATLARARRGIDKPVIDHHLAARQTARLAPAGERLKYHNQKSRAKVRGIKWKLSFEEWWAWWQATGCYHKRGRRKGRYQMARRGDAGAYELGNIECVTVEQNRAAVEPRCGVRNPMALLTPAQVQMIRASPASNAALARELAVSAACIGHIRRGETWNHVLSRPWR